MGDRGRGLGSRARPCTHNAGEVGVFRVRHGGGEAGLGDRGLGGAGAGDRVGEEAGSGFPAKATVKGAAEEQEVSRQESPGGRVPQKSRGRPATTPLKSLGLVRATGNEVMARRRRVALWDM